MRVKTHRTFFLILFTLCLGICLSASAIAESFGVIYNTDTLNLRRQGSSSSEWLGSYPGGTWVEITGSQNNFYRVCLADGNVGYMSKNYIRVSQVSPAQPILLVTNQNGGAFLNFRSQASLNAPVLGIFYSGVPLLKLGELNGWYWVQINGQAGYVRTEYVTPACMPGSGTVATIKTPNNTAMNLRVGPGYAYSAIQQYAGDSYVMVLDKGNGWWRVAIDGCTGFMDSAFLLEGLHAAKDINARKSGDAYALVTGIRASQTLNLRESASAGSAILAKLSYGERLRVDGHGTEWSQVTSSQTGISGYVMTRYLSLYNLPTTPTRLVVSANGQYVNLRVTPDMTQNNVLACVPAGQRVTVLAPGNNWCRVSYAGVTGYMLSYFLQ